MFSLGVDPWTFYSNDEMEYYITSDKNWHMKENKTYKNLYLYQNSQHQKIPTFCLIYMLTEV